MARKRLFWWGTLLLLVVMLFTACDVSVKDTSTGGNGNGNGSGNGGPTAKEPNWGVQTKTAGCEVQGPLPDTACTPGDILPEATKEKICVPGYASSVRHVTTSTKNKVYAAYGIKTHAPGQYEIDHQVSLQLGGSNEISNLWPEAASPKPGFHEKDKVENFLHDQICNGKMTLREAQIKIATNWVEVYNTMGNYNNDTSDG